MRRNKGLILLAVLIFMLPACSKGGGTEVPTAEPDEPSLTSMPSESEPLQAPDDLESLMLRLQERVSYDELLETLYDDFDGNGTYELIADVVVAPNAEIWLITQDEASLLHTTYTMPELYVIDPGDVKLPTARSSELSDGDPVQIWWITDAKARHISISARGLVDVVGNTSGEICAVIQGRNENEDGGARYWLPYYFYQEDGQLREYGAVSISLDHLYSQPGAAELVQGMIDEAAGDQITEVLYRGNGVIHINYIQALADSSPRHLTLRWDGTVLEYEDMSFHPLLTETGAYQAYCSEDSGAVVFPDTDQVGFSFQSVFELPVFHSTDDLDDMKYLFHDDETARSIANFLYLSSRSILPLQEDFSLTGESHMDYVMEISIIATPYDGDIKCKEHVDQVAKLLFGDDVQTEHLDREDSWFWYDGEHGTYTPKPMGFNEYMPVVLSYEDRGDQVEAEIVYLTLFTNGGDMPNDYYDPIGDIGHLATQEEVVQYCLEIAPRYVITLGKRNDQTYYYRGHIYAPA